MKKDVFDNVCYFEKKFGLQGLSSEKKRYVTKTIVDGKRNGKLDTRVTVRILDQSGFQTANLCQKNGIVWFWNGWH
jgi:hypothetical protein